MKNDMEPKGQLDKLLQKWASKNQPPLNDVSAFTQRLHESLEAKAGPPPDLSFLPDRQSADSGSFRLSSARTSLFAVVACMLLAVGMLWLLNDADLRLSQSARTSTTDTAIVNGSTAPQQPSTVNSFRKQRLLFEQLQSIYQEPLLGFAESPEDLVIAFDERSPDERTLDAGAVSDSDTWLLIRLSVERQFRPGTVAAHDGGVVWQMDVALRDQQLFTTAGDEDDRTDLSVWSCVAEDGLVLVDTRIQLSAPVRLAGNESHLVRPGLRIQIAELDDDLVLWQYVELMHRQG